MARTWVCPMMPSPRIKPAVAVLEAAGYVRDGSGRSGTYNSEEAPMYRDGGYLADLVVCEDPSRPVIDQLHAMLTPDAKGPPT